MPARGKPLVTALMHGQRRVLASVDDAAARLGLTHGMTVTHAQSLVPDLCVVNATPEEDEAALLRLALWCIRYSPLVTPDPPDGIFIDVAGSAHLFQGEAALLKDLCQRLGTQGVTARAAILISTASRIVPRTSIGIWLSTRVFWRTMGGLGTVVRLARKLRG